MRSRERRMEQKNWYLLKKVNLSSKFTQWKEDTISRNRPVWPSQ